MDQQAKPTRVAVLTSAHVADDTRIYHRECKALASAGYTVVLVAQQTLDDPGEGIESVGLGQVRNRFMRVAIQPWHAIASGLRTGAQILHLHDPEMLPAGFLLRALGKQVIYDVHEDYPRRIRQKSYLPRGLRGLAAGLVAALEALAGRSFAAIVAATPEIAARFPARRCVTVQNFPDVAEFGDIPTDDYAERAPSVVYVGDLTRERGVVAAIDAIERCRTPGVGLDLVGPASCPHVRARIDAGLPAAVRLHGRQDRTGVRRALAGARVGLVTLHPLPGYDESWPVKLFEYMAAGLPVIASDFPSWRARFGELGCLRFADPTDPEQLARAIDVVLADPETGRAMGRRGRAAAAERFSWDSQRRTLLACYAKMLDARMLDGRPS
jgi:hypothetical protein